MPLLSEPAAQSIETTALLLSQDLSFTVGTRVLPDLVDGDVLVDVEYAGICGSDLHVLRTGQWVRYWPATLGHEVAGRVRESRHPDFAAGHRVVADSRIPHRVKDCRPQSNRLAEDLQWLGEACPGGHARAMVIAGHSLYPVPDLLETVDAVLAEPLAVVMCAVDQLHIEHSASAAILGYGPMGALVHAEMSRRWPDIAFTVAEPNRMRADLAWANGATVAPLTEGIRYDVVVDAAGYDGSLEAAIDAAEFGGTILLVALGHGSATVLPSTIVEHSLHIVGSVGFDDRHVELALHALAVEPNRYNWIVSHAVDLDQVPTFLSGEGMREALKVLIRCTE